MNIKNLAEDLGLGEDVHFLGFKNNPFKYMKRSDVFVLSSLYEGFGNVITEAMACGTPVVSTDCRSGPREILAPGTGIGENTEKIERAEYGILTPVPDEEKHEPEKELTEEEGFLAEALTKVLKDEDLRKKYRERSQDRIEEFRPEKITKRWIKVIEDNK